MGKRKSVVLGDEEAEKKQQEEVKARKAKKAEDAEQSEDVKPENKETKKKSKTAKSPSVPNKRERSSKYQQAKKKVEDKNYSLKSAVELLKKISYAKFDETVELHLNVDSEGMRGDVELPHSTGKTVRVEIVDEKVLSDIESGNINFDILIAHPSFMPKLAKYARTLGPKGLMPNPKAGTISTEPEKVAEKFKKGSLQWKGEAKFPIIHQSIAKLSQETNEIVENAQSFIDAVGHEHIKAIHISASMTPSVRVEVGE